MLTQVLEAGFSVFSVWGHVGQAAWPWVMAAGMSSGTREEEMQTGFVAPSTSLPTDVSSPCDVPQFFGWFSWLGVVAEWQSRSSVLSVPSCWVGLGAQSWGGVRDLTGSTFFFTQPKGVRQHLRFFSGQRCLF